jgi:hypothetical protein
MEVTLLAERILAWVETYAMRIAKMIKCCKNVRPFSLDGLFCTCCDETCVFCCLNLLIFFFAFLLNEEVFSVTDDQPLLRISIAPWDSLASLKIA